MKNRQAGIVFVLITVSIDMIAFGILAPVVPKLVLGFLHGDMSKAALYNGAFGTLFAVLQLFCSPILGMLSDRFGRRPIIILSNFGTAIDYFLCAMAGSIGWLFAAYTVVGITTSSISTAYAYITDVTTPEKRAQAMGLIGAAFGMGFVIGPALGGLLGNIDVRLPFWVTAGMSLANALYGFFVLPESLTAEKRQRVMAWRRANPFGALAFLRRHTELARLATINFIEYVAHDVLPVVFTFYCMYRYHWNLATVGIALAIVGISMSLVQVLLIGRVVERFGERRTLLIGLAAGAMSFALVGLAPTTLTQFAATAIVSLWGLAGPPAQSLMTHRVGESEQGELQGAIGSIRSLGMLIGPGLWSAIFAFSINTAMHPGWILPGLAWYAAGLLLATTLLVAVNVQDVRIKSGLAAAQT